MLEDMLDRWRRGARGPLPQLTPVQLLNALVLIDQEGPVGRRALAQALQINDGVTRGLLERLAEQGLVEVSEGTGVRLSRQGRETRSRRRTGRCSLIGETVVPDLRGLAE